MLEISLSEVKNFGPFFRSSRSMHSEGVQIDLLIEEKNQTLTLVECKNATQPIGVGLAREIEQKIKKARFPKKFFLRKVLVTGGPVSTELKQSDYFNQIIYFEDFLDN